MPGQAIENSPLVQMNYCRYPRNHRKTGEAYNYLQSMQMAMKESIKAHVD
jgi:hypothetical protein